MTAAPQTTAIDPDVHRHRGWRLTRRFADTAGGPGRFIRYAGVSIVAFVLAQLGLALGYGILHWNVPASVVLSLAVSVGPAYALNRRYVWPRTSDGGSLAFEINGFVVIAVIGTVTTIGVVALAETLAHRITDSHLALSLVVNGASIVATGVVWVLRYVVLDRFLFRDRSGTGKGPDGRADPDGRHGADRGSGNGRNRI